MDNRFKFTQANIRALPIPENGRKDYYDTLVPKLACRVSSTGNKSFAVINRIGGKVFRVTIGKTNSMSVKEAQDKAMIEIVKMANGIDPVTEKRKELSLREILEHYIKNRHPKNGKHLKQSTIDGYRYVLQNSFKDWLEKPVSTITREMVIKRYSSLTATGTTTANVAARVLRLTLNHAKDIKAVTEIATDILKEKQAWHKNKRRQRILKMNDIQSWYEAVNTLTNEQAKVYLLMLVYMGFRAGEALGLTWADVNLKKKTITARDTKNGTDHTLPIPMPMMAYIHGLKQLTGSSKWVFASEDQSKHMTIPKKQIAKVVKMTDIEFSSHDLRRSFAGYAEAVGVPFGAIKRLLNHAIPESEVTLGYLITEDETLAENMNKIGAFIHAKATQKDNIIQFTSKNG